MTSFLAEAGPNAGLERIAASLSPEVLNSRVLVVDDVLINRLLIGEVLQSLGISHVLYAADGREALEQAARHKPDIVVLDIDMPEIDGIEVCRRLKDDPEHSRIPVLMQTAFDGPKERSRAFDAGASDFISKPINNSELLARVKVHLENRHLIQGLQSYRDRVQAELALARDMQAALLPSRERVREIQAATGLSIAAYFSTSSELGGDFFALRLLGDHKLGVTMVDFSGHGVTAALNTFRLHTLMGLGASGAGLEGLPHDDPAAKLALLNDHLHALLPRGQYATVTHLVIDSATGAMIYAAAGSPPPLLYDPAADETVELDSRGLPLGFVPGHSYEQRDAALPPGGVLLLYSDALIESPDEDGAMLDLAEICALIRPQAGDGGAAEPLDRLLERFFAGREEPLPDDLTLVCLRRPV